MEIISSYQKKRIDYLDIVKGIGIILVIFGHLSMRSQLTRIIVYSFHMPLFFIISGYFDKEKPLHIVLKNNLFSLIFPAYGALVFDIFCLIAFSLINNINLPNLHSWLDGIILHGGVWWNYPVWFLMTLGVCKILKCCLNKVNFILTECVALIFVIFCAFNFNSYLPNWWLTNSIMAFPFFIIGVLIRKYNLFETILHLNIIWLILGTFLWISFAIFNGYTDINIQENGNNYLIFLLTGMLGTLCLVRITKSIKCVHIRNVFSLLGKESMIILISHYYLCRKICPEVLALFNLENNLLIQIIVTLIITIIYYIFLLILQKMKNKKAL